MKYRYFKTNNEFFKFINSYKKIIYIKELKFTKNGYIRVCYDII